MNTDEKPTANGGRVSREDGAPDENVLLRGAPAVAANLAALLLLILIFTFIFGPWGILIGLLAFVVVGALTM